MKKIITISREFGSGGRSIGKTAAEKLGYKYYDKDIIEKIAKSTGLSERYIEENGEYAKGTNLFSYAFLGRTPAGKSVEDYIWETQRSIIEEIAEKENCVIVGRCADYILGERKDCMHVFIHANMDFKMERILKLYGESKIKPEKRLKEKDKKRSTNYKYYTDRQWGYAGNYHLTLDSSQFGLEKCCDIIVELAQQS